MRENDCILLERVKKLLWICSSVSWCGQRRPHEKQQSERFGYLLNLVLVVILAQKLESRVRPTMILYICF